MRKRCIICIADMLVKLQEHMYVYMCVCVCVCAHMHMHMFIYISMYVYMHICTLSNVTFHIIIVYKLHKMYKI